MTKPRPLFIAATLAAGALALTGCSAAQNAANAASSAAAAAIDSKVQGQLDELLGEGDVKSKVCEQVKSNADQAYATAISALNDKQAGAGDTVKKVVSVEQFKEYLTKKCG